MRLGEHFPRWGERILARCAGEISGDFEGTGKIVQAKFRVWTRRKSDFSGRDWVSISHAGASEFWECVQARFRAILRVQARCAGKITNSFVFDFFVQLTFF